MSRVAELERDTAAELNKTDQNNAARVEEVNRDDSI